MDKKAKKTMFWGLAGVVAAVGLGIWLRDKKKKEEGIKGLPKDTPPLVDVNFGV